MDPADAERVVALGLRTVMAGDIEEADALFVAVLQSFPDHATACALRGVVAQRQEDLEGARAHLERAVALDDSNPEHACNLAAVLGALGRSEAAEQVLRRALARRSDHLEPRGNLGIALMHARRCELRAMGDCGSSATASRSMLAAPAASPRS